MLRSDLCDYSDAFIVIKGKIKVADSYANIRKKRLISKNNALFRWYILKINNTFIDNAEALDIVMPMCNLLEYSDNRCMKSRSLNSKYSEYKTKIIQSTPDNNSRSDIEVVIQLKHLSNFWRSLDLPLINWEIKFDCEITFKISFKCLLLHLLIHKTTQATSSTFQIINAKIYVPVVTLSINDKSNY